MTVVSLAWHSKKLKEELLQTTSVPGHSSYE